MEKFKKFVILMLIFGSIYGSVYAEEIVPVVPPTEEETEIITETPPAETPTIPSPVSINLKISTNEKLIYDSSISVDACNNDNGATEELEATAYCAIRQSGISSEWNWSWAPGAFLDSLDGVRGFTSQDSNGNDVYHFWSWYLNDSEASTAMNQYELSAGDIISLKFIEPLTSPQPVTSSGGGGGSSSKKSSGDEKVLGEATIQTFEASKALAYLESEQKEDGSFGEEMYTDWVAISIASNPEKLDSVFKLIKYFSGSKYEGLHLTDHERRAMALMSFGLNPYNINGINYIEKIVSSFDGKQLGDANEDNDDIFGILVLSNAGYKYEDPIIKESLAFIAERQKENGSWDNSVDMTGAGIQALAAFSSDEKIKMSLTKAKEFLLSSQKENGSWNDSVSSTAWAMSGIIALGEKPEDWKKNGFSPADFLAGKQDSDGGIKEVDKNNKLWQTSYVVTALSGKTWPEIMQKFSKIEPQKAPLDPKPKPKIPTTKKSAGPEKEKATPSETIASFAFPVIETTINENTEKPQASWVKRLLKNIFGF